MVVLALKVARYFLVFLIFILVITGFLTLAYGFSLAEAIETYGKGIYYTALGVANLLIAIGFVFVYDLTRSLELGLKGGKLLRWLPTAVVFSTMIWTLVKWSIIKLYESDAYARLGDYTTAIYDVVLSMAGVAFVSLLFTVWSRLRWLH